MLYSRMQLMVTRWNSATPAWKVSTDMRSSGPWIPRRLPRFMIAGLQSLLAIDGTLIMGFDRPRIECFEPEETS